jgi:NADH:ubiquinone oxidoreductase subunit 6 (subunit J)
VLLEILMLIKTSFTFNPYINIELKNFYVNWLDQTDTFNEIEAVGQIMYTQYVVQFLIAGNILLLAVIGVVVLTLNMRVNVSLEKKQSDFRQLSRTYKNVLISTK